MARRVGVLGAKRRAEGVDIGECRGEDLALELARDRKVGLLPEEVLGAVDVAVLGLRWLCEVEGRHAKHVPGTLGIAGGDDRRVDVMEISFLEKLMYGVRQPAAHAKDGPEKVR